MPKKLQTWYYLIRNWLEARSRWSKLRDLGQSGLVRSSVLMPLFGYLLLFNEKVRDFLTILYDASWPFSLLPSMWRVWFLYLGTVSLAVGSLLFAWWCPDDVKQHATAYRMVDADRNHITGQNQTPRLQRTLKTLYDNMSKWEDSIFKSLGFPRLDPDHPNLGVGTIPDLPSPSDQWGLGLNHIWTVSNIKWPPLRIAIYLMFRAGLILVAVPAVVTFVQVISIPFGQVISVPPR